MPSLEEEVVGLHLEPAWKCPLPELADLLNRAYGGYFVPLSFTPSTLARTLRVHGIDLYTSQVVYLNDVAVGTALLAHRGWTTRLAAMGIVPESRHTGIGQWLLDKILAAGRQRGDRVFTLEVIEDSTTALRLYEKSGTGHVPLPCSSVEAFP
jgi:ribosomal protein S18 acetylase RimI-like enzyme